MTESPGETWPFAGRVHRTVFFLSWTWALVWNAMMLFLLWDMMVQSPTGDPPAPLLYPVPLVDRLFELLFRAIGVALFYLGGLLSPILLLVMVTLPWLPSR